LTSAPTKTRFSPGFLDEIDGHLDAVVGASAQGLVTTGGGKFYSNGLDLDWLAVMRADRGYFCFPEADIRIPFTPGMAALIQAKLTPQAAVASMTTGRRFGGADAASLGLVDAVAAEGAVTPAAVDILRPLDGKDPGTLGAIKQTIFGPAVRALTASNEEPQSN
jgi:enoyl-CoA hydratase/carnithine racemase